MKIKIPPMPKGRGAVSNPFADDGCFTTADINNRDQQWLELVGPVVEALNEVVAAADGNGWSQLDPLLEKQRAALSAITEEQQ